MCNVYVYVYVKFKIKIYENPRKISKKYTDLLLLKIQEWWNTVSSKKCRFKARASKKIMCMYMFTLTFRVVASPWDCSWTPSVRPRSSGPPPSVSSGSSKCRLLTQGSLILKLSALKHWRHSGKTLKKLVFRL